jgi:biopolymer transport protein ExbD
MKLRRPSDEPRLEMTPLLDVIFLLLTFFIMLQPQMIRATLLNLDFQRLEAAAPGETAETIAIELDDDGRILVNGEPTTMPDLRRRLQTAAEQPEPPSVLLASTPKKGSEDRLPLFQRIMDSVMRAGLDLNMVGQPRVDAASPKPSSPDE